VAGSNFATRLGAETALGTGFAVGAEELTERGVPAPIALAGGLATGVGALGAVRGVRGAADDAVQTAIRQAEGPLEASTRGAIKADPVIPGVTPRGRANVAGGATEVVQEAADTAFEAPPTVRRLFGVDPIEE